MPYCRDVVSDKRPTIHLRELGYPANLLTLLRLSLVPLIVRDLQHPDHRRRTVALVALALFTDIIDGPIARSRGEVSNLGKILDPITDKLLLNGTTLSMARGGRFPRWVAIMLLVRDILILAGSWLIYRRRTEIKTAQPLGKASTALFGASVLLYMVDGPRSGRPALILALLALGGSVVQYARTFLRSLKH